MSDAGAEEGLHTWRWGREIPLLEHIIFGARPVLLCLFLVVTVVLGWYAGRLEPDASFEKMIPLQHPYIQAMLRHIEDLGATGTTVQIVVEARRGDIFDADYLETVREVTDAAFYLPGVDRNRLRSLWTPNVRWMAVTEEGFEGDQLIDAAYDGSAGAMERLRANLLRSGELGRLVADDFRSSIVEVPLFDRDPRTGEAMDYWAFSQALESEIREPFSSEAIRIRIVGFAKMVGDLLDGIRAILLFALLTLLLTALLLFLYSRSTGATVAVLFCAVIAVAWQLGLLQLLGYGLNAFSILVPFLVFAIAVSHGVQMVNAIAVNTADGVPAKAAARLAFRQLYIPGSTALVSDAVGFLTMLLVPIQVIRDLGLAASLGVAVILLTNLVLLPVLLSYRGVGEASMSHLKGEDGNPPALWLWLSRCARFPGAAVVLLLGAGLVLGGLQLGRQLAIGDLDTGAPELHPDSRYNRDSAFINAHYATSSDVLIIMVETAAETCADYDSMVLIDEFSWVMRNVKGVESALSSATVSRLVLSGFNEGSLKWATITRNQAALNSTFNPMPAQLVNRDCSLSPVVLFLSDHRAGTLQRVLGAVDDYAAAHNSATIRFVPAAGNAGVEAATNQVITGTRIKMLLLVYAAVAALVFFSFGSMRSVICIIVPLALTSILCQALMVLLGIGVKVATLPVIALGVGVGVDYGIYIYARLRRCHEREPDLSAAYLAALQSTGKAVAFTGITLAIGVATWIFSPIKFQADMGKLLTFMFLFNMLGALVMLPALAALLPPRREVT